MLFVCICTCIPIPLCMFESVCVCVQTLWPCARILCKCTAVFGCTVCVGVSVQYMHSQCAHVKWNLFNHHTEIGWQDTQVKNKKVQQGKRQIKCKTQAECKISNEAVKKVIAEWTYYITSNFNMFSWVWEGNGLLTLYRRTNSVSVAGKALNLPHTNTLTHTHSHT